MKQLVACLILTFGLGVSFQAALACDCSKGKKCECSKDSCKCGKNKEGKTDCGKGSCDCGHDKTEKKS